MKRGTLDEPRTLDKPRTFRHRVEHDLSTVDVSHGMRRASAR